MPRQEIILQDQETTGFSSASHPRYENEENNALDLSFLKSIFLRRLGVMIAIFMIVFTAAVYLTFTAPKQYAAYAEVVVNTRIEAAPDVLRESQDLVSGEAELSTELRILYSRDLALGIVDRFSLMDNSIFNPLLEVETPLPAQPSAQSQDAAAAQMAAAQEQQTRFLVADILRSGLRASRIGNTYSISISYLHGDPFVAAQMANAFAEAYVLDQLTRKQQTSRGNATFLNDRIEELRLQAQLDLEQVQKYRIRNNLLSTAGATLIEQDISALNQQLAQAHAAAAEDGARLTTARARLRGGNSGDDVGDVLASGVVQSLRAQRANISVRVAELRGRYGPEHPELKRGEIELQDIDAQIQTEINRVISGLEGRYNVSRQRVESLTTSLNRLKDQLAENNTASVELGDLERRATASQELYESFLNSYKQTIAREGVEKADARILTMATIPRGPSKPNVILNIAFGIVLGSTLAAAAAFILEMTFGGITSTNEVASKLRAPSIGAIPLNNSVSPNGKTVLDTLANVPHSPLQESLSNLLTTLHFRMNRQQHQVVYVTSSLPDEGKTTLVSALGFVSASQGVKTLIIDCDRMKRDLTMRMSDAPQAGLKEALDGTITVREAIVGTTRENCDFLPIGNVNEADSQLFTSGGFEQILDQLRAQYELIIMDGAPIMPFSEARNLATHANFVLFAVHWRKTKASTVLEALKSLPWEHANSTGVVLTKVNAKLQRRFGVDDVLAYSDKYLKYYRPAN